MRISDWSSDLCSSDLEGSPNGRKDGEDGGVQCGAPCRIAEVAGLPEPVAPCGKRGANFPFSCDLFARSRVLIGSRGLASSLIAIEAGKEGLAALNTSSTLRPASLPEQDLAERFQTVRERTLDLVAPLSDADASAQSMVDSSPDKRRSAEHKSELKSLIRISYLVFRLQ